MSTEKNEKEIRQVNFRIDQASADAFRSFCTANGMNQAQGFDHLIQVLELNNAKAATPGRAVEIENFERLTKDLLAAYLTSLELGNTTEARVAERFKTDLQRKDRTIDELREKADQAVDEKEKLAGSFETLTEEKKQIEENALSMKQAMEAARKSANDLEELNHVLRDQVEQLQKKAAHYDEIVKISAAIKSENEQLSRQQEELSRQLANETAAKKDYEEQIGKLTAMVRDLEHAAVENKMQLAGLNSQLKEQETDCQNRLKQAQMQADLAMERAVAAKEREMQEEFRKLDRENARLIAELEHFRASADASSGKNSGNIKEQTV